MTAKEYGEYARQYGRSGLAALAQQLQEEQAKRDWEVALMQNALGMRSQDIQRELGLGNLEVARGGLDIQKGELALKKDVSLADIATQKADLALREKLGLGQLSQGEKELALRETLARLSEETQRRGQDLNVELGKMSNLTQQRGQDLSYDSTKAQLAMQELLQKMNLDFQGKQEWGLDYAYTPSGTDTSGFVIGTSGNYLGGYYGRDSAMNRNYGSSGGLYGTPTSRLGRTNTRVYPTSYFK